jgi:protein-disulfide isomerase
LFGPRAQPKKDAPPATLPDIIQKVDPPAMLMAERTFGDTAAPVVIFEFSDFQCPYCREFWRTVLPSLEREYFRPGKARLVYLNLPIPQIHANAFRAHEFAMCAAREKRFRPYHDLLYEHQAEWEKLTVPDDYFARLATRAGANADAVTKCAHSHELAWLVAGEAQGAAQSGLTGTPSFIIEGQPFKGSPPIEDWRRILDYVYRVKLESKKKG